MPQALIDKTIIFPFDSSRSLYSFNLPIHYGGDPADGFVCDMVRQIICESCASPNPRAAMSFLPSTNAHAARYVLALSHAPGATSSGQNVLGSVTRQHT